MTCWNDILCNAVENYLKRPRAVTINGYWDSQPGFRGFTVQVQDGASSQQETHLFEALCVAVAKAKNIPRYKLPVITQLLPDTQDLFNEFEKAVLMHDSFRIYLGSNLIRIDLMSRLESNKVHLSGAGLDFYSAIRDMLSNARKRHPESPQKNT